MASTKDRPRVLPGARWFAALYLTISLTDPYYQLNYVYRGKKTSQFIRREILSQVRTDLANYKQFRRLTERWIGLALQVAQAKDKLIA